MLERPALQMFMQVMWDQVHCSSVNGRAKSQLPFRHKIPGHNSSLVFLFFKEQQIKPLDDLLEIEGANGQEVPHFGYVQLDISFSKEFVGQEIKIPTLALVVPNMREGVQEQLLIDL